MNRLFAWIAALVIRLVGSTLRMTVEDRGGIVDHPEHPPVIIAFWHNRVGLMPFFWDRYCHGRIALTFISRSRDGQFITDVAGHFGIKAVRGSSSRHGTSAMLGAIRAANDRRTDIAITPDGPRGPRYRIRPGLIRLAQATQRPIVPVTFRLFWKYRLKSWDRFLVPIPFSACYLVTGDPIFVASHASEAELVAIEERLTEALGGD